MPNKPFTAAIEIGIGTGRGQQFLAEDAEGNLWIADYNTEQYVKLSNPHGLSAVLLDRLERL